MAWVFQNELRLKLSDDIYSHYLFVCFKVFRKIQILHVSSKTEGRPRIKWCSEVKRPWIGQVQVGVVKFCYWTTVSKTRLILWLCRLIWIAVPLPEFLLRRLGWQLLRYKFWSWRCYFVCWSEHERCTFVGCVATGWSDSSGSCSCTGCQQRSEVLDWTSWKVKCDSDFAFLPADSLSCKPKLVNFSFCLNVSVGKCRIYAFGNEVFFWIDYYQPGCLQTGAIEQNISVWFFSTSSIQTGFQRSEARVSCCLPFTQYCM